MQVSMRYRKYGFKIFSVPRRMLWRCCTTCPISRKCGAAALDRHWSVVRTNQAAPRFFGSFVDLEARPKPRNLLVLMFDQAGMRPFVEEWEKVAAGLLHDSPHHYQCTVHHHPEVLARMKKLGI